MPTPWWLPFGKVPEIDSVALAEMLAKGPVQLLDVRTPGEFREARIDGAANHPIQGLRAQVNALAFSRDEVVVAICRSAHRSVPAVRLLRDSGFTHAVQLAGGMKAWTASGGATIGDGD